MYGEFVAVFTHLSLFKGKSNVLISQCKDWRHCLSSVVERLRLDRSTLLHYFIVLDGRWWVLQCPDANRSCYDELICFTLN